MTCWPLLAPRPSIVPGPIRAPARFAATAAGADRIARLVSGCAQACPIPSPELAPRGSSRRDGPAAKTGRPSPRPWHPLAADEGRSLMPSHRKALGQAGRRADVGVALVACAWASDERLQGSGWLPPIPCALTPALQLAGHGLGGGVLMLDGMDCPADRDLLASQRHCPADRPRPPRCRFCEPSPDLLPRMRATIASGCPEADGEGAAAGAPRRPPRPGDRL